MSVCSVEGCESKVHSLGYCSKHYQRFKKRGTTNLQVGLKTHYSKYSKNEDYFNQMSLQSSYYSGYLAADGCVSKSPIYSICLSLAIKDLSVLERFKADIEWTGPIRYHSSGRSSKPMCTVTICGAKKYIETLNDIYNITPAKTFTIKPPTGLDEEHKLAYLVGLIDGDGSISAFGKYNNKYRLQITTASLLMAEWLCDELGVLGGRPQGASIYIDKRGPLKVYDIKLTCRFAREAILKLKSVEVVKLDRKWEKYDFYIPEEDIRISNAKIHIDTAREIKAAYNGKHGDYQRLANMYGLHRVAISDLINGRTWKHLDSE